ncbi:hypothetical protein DPMN_174639 [Dreissena polymorpha]|uniref:Uncharacterized protein n=1 Tax=Dreissena polymorpha TaxID=45954 RepID=A0A9D4E7H9_DREPO|nr:hypothetical protein DPMN_174639 [Dreissena polymorpha]
MMIHVKVPKQNRFKDPKQKWAEFYKLTSYKRDEGGNVLPLIDINDSPVYGNQEKSEILKGTFFGSTHIANERFDDDFQKPIETELR